MQNEKDPRLGSVGKFYWEFKHHRLMSIKIIFNPKSSFIVVAWLSEESKLASLTGPVKFVKIIVSNETL